jgi:hypothetical protein
VTARPPRPQRREPFAPATDYVEPPVEVDAEDQEPFLLRSDHIPTMRDLSEQIAAVGMGQTALLKQVQLSRKETAFARQEVAGARGEIAELRTLVVADHAPRITAVEQSERQSRIAIPPGLRRGAAKGAVGIGLASIYPIAEAVWPLVKKLIEGQ